MLFRAEDSMGNIKGFSGEKRLESQTYTTVSQLGSDKSGLDVLPKAMFSVNGATALTVTAQVYGRIKATDGIKKDVQRVTFGVAHAARVGDVLRFTTGLSASIEATIVEVVDANNVYVGTKLPIGALDDCLLMRHITLTVDSSGSLSVASGPNQFIKDAVTETVTEDTVTPANNLAQPSAMFVYRNGVQLPITHDTATPANTVPMPVQITDLTGDINVTAGDINVQTTHLGANADSQRIGDGVTEWGIEVVTKKGLVKDVLVETAINNVGSQLPATIGIKADAASLSVTQSTEDRVVQDAIKTAVEASASSLPSALGIQADAASLSVTQSTEDRVLTNRVVASVEGLEDQLPAALGSVVDASSLSVTQSTEDKVIQDGIKTAVEGLEDQLPATLGIKADTASLSVTHSTEDLIVHTAIKTAVEGLEGQLPTALGSAVDAASLSVTQSTEDKVIQDDIKTAVETVAASATPLDALAFGLYDAAVSGTITDAAYTEIIANTGATAGKKLRLVCEFGVSLLIAVGAAASEVDKAVCQKGGFSDGPIDIVLPANSRISVKAAVSGESVTAGTLYMNVVG